MCVDVVSCVYHVVLIVVVLLFVYVGMIVFMVDFWR